MVEVQGTMKDKEIKQGGRIKSIWGELEFVTWPPEEVRERALWLF